MQKIFLIAAACWLLSFALSASGEDAVFSGPQVGEPLPSFLIRGVFGEDAGKEIDIVARANGKPVVLIFVHDVNRQSISMTRILSHYTASRSVDGLHTGVIWLQDDATQAENELHRIRHALSPDAPIGISLDGGEGPGSYGLNRAVTLTILIGKESKVTANFPLVQPSLQVDLPRILEAVVQLVGGPKPNIEELTEMPRSTPRSAVKESSPDLRPLMQPLISKSATVTEVDQAALSIERAIRTDAAVRKELGRIAHTIMDAGKLTNYGTARAQYYLEKWAKEIDNSGDKVDKQREAK